MANKAEVTVTTKEIAQELAARVEGVNKGKAKEIADEIVQIIFDKLVDGQNVKLTGVGVLEARSVEQGTALNPRMYSDLLEDGVDAETAKSRATVSVAAHIKPGFKPSKTLKDAMKAQG